MDINFSTITELHQKRINKEISTREIIQSYIDRIENVDGQINAFLFKNFQKSLEIADKTDKKISSGEAINLIEGMPIAVKDIFNIKGTPTTCASKILQGYISPFESTVTEKLEAAGYCPIGKTNMDEFAMGSTGENSAFGPTKNPWNLNHVPGGSSSGSAAAVSAGMAIASIGTDTGGSIRQPASFNNLVGLKPTYGLVSRYGIVAYASSFDQAGPITRSVEDSAVILDIIAGFDSRDATSLNSPKESYSSQIRKDIKGKRVGVIKEIDLNQCDEEIRTNFENSLKLMEEGGAEIKEVSIHNLQEAIATYYIIAPSEASSNLGRYDGVRFGMRSKESSNLADLYKRSREEGFGKETKLRILLGTFALSSGYYDAYYSKAKMIQEMLKNQFISAFNEVDLIATPVSPTLPYKLGEKTSDPLEMYLSDAFTVSVNLAGVPSISVPAGFSESGLPIGIQFIAKHLDEKQLLEAGSWMEIANNFTSPKLAI